MRATMTEARTAQRGGFIKLTARRRPDMTFHVNRWEGASVDRTLNAGNEVSDSRDVERSDRLSNLSTTGSDVDVDRSEWLVE
jgi:hypothetical protein